MKFLCLMGNSTCKNPARLRLKPTKQGTRSSKQSRGDSPSPNPSRQGRGASSSPWRGRPLPFSSPWRGRLGGGETDSLNSPHRLGSQNARARNLSVDCDFERRACSCCRAPKTPFPQDSIRTGDFSSSKSRLQCPQDEGLGRFLTKLAARRKCGLQPSATQENKSADRRTGTLGRHRAETRPDGAVGA